MEVSNCTTKTELDFMYFFFMYLFFMHFLGYHLSNEENNGINPTTVKATYTEEMVSYSSQA